jgi:hypothetical protein
MRFALPVISVLILLWPDMTVARQKSFIRLEPSLTENSDIMEVEKPRRNRMLTRYRFGPYKIESGRPGIESYSTTGRGLFKYTEKTRQRRRDRFVMSRGNSEKITVRPTFIQSYHTVDRSFNIGILTIETGDFEIRQSTRYTITDIEVDNGHSGWQMTVTQPFLMYGDNRYEIDFVDDFEGILTNGETMINISLMLEFSPDDPEFRAIARGYIFSINNSPIAAVQVYPGNRKFVCILNDLLDELKFILAGASATLLLYHD